MRSYLSGFVVGRKDILPVCIKAGALADNVPERDLWISPNHAMYFEDEQGGVLIEAKDLVNGVSIVQAERVDRVEYFHIELETHDVIIAEGALSESFIDDDSRAMFHNAHDYASLYAQEHAAPAHYCAPRLDEGYEVEAVRQRLMLRAESRRDVDAPRQATQQIGAPGAVTSTASAQAASPAGRKTPTPPKRRSVSTFSPTASGSVGSWRTPIAATSKPPASAPATMPSPSCRRQASSLLPDR